VHISVSYRVALLFYRLTRNHIVTCPHAFVCPGLLTSIAREEKYFKNITCVLCHLSRAYNSIIPRRYAAVHAHIQTCVLCHLSPPGVPYRSTSKYIVTRRMLFFAIGILTSIDTEDKLFQHFIYLHWCHPSRCAGSQANIFSQSRLLFLPQDTNDAEDKLFQHVYMCTLSPAMCIQYCPTFRRAVQVHRQTYRFMSRAFFATGYQRASTQRISCFNILHVYIVICHMHTILS